MTRFHSGTLLALLLLTAATTLPARAQVCAGDIYLEFQSQVDAFNCAEVTGNLTIVAGTPNSTDITNLLGLSELTTVGGNFFSENADFLTSLEGLESLTSVGGYFGLYDNGLISSLDPLSSLTSVGGYFGIGNLPNLTDSCFDGLAGLMGFAGGPPNAPAFTGVAGTFIEPFANGPGFGCNAPADLLALAQSLTVTPLNSRGGDPASAPVNLPPVGGKVFYRATGTSNIADGFTMDFWPSVELPSGQVVTRRNPFSITAPAYGAGTFDSGLNFNGGLPSGTYILRFYLGTHSRTSNDGALEVVTFQVEKAAARTGAPTLSERELARMNFDELFGDEDTASVETAPAGELPTATVLGQGYPNPFNPVATVPFTLAQDGEVRLAVYDLLGREVAVLAQGRMAAGAHSATFDAGQLSSGTYLVRFSAPDGRVQTQRLTLLK